MQTVAKKAYTYEDYAQLPEYRKIFETKRA